MSRLVASIVLLLLTTSSHAQPGDGRSSQEVRCENYFRQDGTWVRVGAIKRAGVYMTDSMVSAELVRSLDQKCGAH